MTQFVRLKEYNQKEGHLYQRLTVGGRRMVSGMWYKVDDAMGATLSKIRQPPCPGQMSSAQTPLAFDVAATKKDQLVIDKASKPQTPTESTMDLTTKDFKMESSSARETKPRRGRPRLNG